MDNFFATLCGWMLDRWMDGLMDKLNLLDVLLFVNGASSYCEW